MLCYAEPIHYQKRTLLSPGGLLRIAVSQPTKTSSLRVVSLWGWRDSNPHSTGEPAPKAGGSTIPPHPHKAKIYSSQRDQGNPGEKLARFAIAAHPLPFSTTWLIGIVILTSNLGYVNVFWMFSKYIMCHITNPDLWFHTYEL